jgi:hypothetical protein
MSFIAYFKMESKTQKQHPSVDMRLDSAGGELVMLFIPEQDKANSTRPAAYKGKP